jgi:hypothetical protein
MTENDNSVAHQAGKAGEQRSSGRVRLLPKVTFGLGAAVLAGVVVGGGAAPRRGGGAAPPPPPPPGSARSSTPSPGTASSKPRAAASSQLSSHFKFAPTPGALAA